MQLRWRESIICNFWNLLSFPPFPPLTGAARHFILPPRGVFQFIENMLRPSWQCRYFTVYSFWTLRWWPGKTSDLLYLSSWKLFRNWILGDWDTLEFPIKNICAAEMVKISVSAHVRTNYQTSFFFSPRCGLSYNLWPLFTETKY